MSQNKSITCRTFNHHNGLLILVIDRLFGVMCKKFGRSFPRSATMKVIQYPFDVLCALYDSLAESWRNWWCDAIKPAIGVTVDIIVVQRNHLLLVRRSNAPFEYQHALPSGHVEPELDSDLESAARRELKQKTNIDSEQKLVLLTAIGNNQRDPRGFTISVVFVLHLPNDEEQEAKAGDDALALKWIHLDEFATRSGYTLPFDHSEIVQTYLTASNALNK